MRKANDLHEEHGYTVMVADNFHYMDESETYRLAEYASCAEATEVCKQIVDEYLLSVYVPGISYVELWSSYSGFGEDPFIISRDTTCQFSAWDYARQRCEALCQAAGSSDQV